MSWLLRSTCIADHKSLAVTSMGALHAAVWNLIDSNFGFWQTLRTMPVQPTTLDEWRKGRGWSYADLARELGVSGEAVRRYCTGQRAMPRPAILARIRVLTEGAVTADSFAGPAEDTLL